jgi:hypothetical protein
MANDAKAQLFPIFRNGPLGHRHDENGASVGLLGRVRGHHHTTSAGYGTGCDGYNASYSYGAGNGCTGYSSGYSAGNGYTGYSTGGYTYYRTTPAFPLAPGLRSTPTQQSDTSCWFNSSNKSNWPYPIAWCNSAGCVVAFFTSDTVAPAETPYGLTKVYKDKTSQPASKSAERGTKAVPKCDNPNCTCPDCDCEGTCKCMVVMAPDIGARVMGPMLSEPFYPCPPGCPNCPR